VRCYRCKACGDERAVGHVVSADMLRDFFDFGCPECGDRNRTLVWAEGPDECLVVVAERAE